MEKSKFGFSAMFYPMVMLLCVLFSSVWAGLLILGFVLVAENSEKLAKQTMHAFMYFFVWQVYLLITGQLMKGYSFWAGKLLDLLREPLSYSTYDTFVKVINNIRGFFNGLGSLIYVIYIILILVMGVFPLLKGKDMALPGKGFVNKIYGEIKNKKGKASAPDAQ